MRLKPGRRWRYVIEYNRFPPPSFTGRWKPDPVTQKFLALNEAIGCATLLVLNNKTASAVVTDRKDNRVYQAFTDGRYTYVKEVLCPVPCPAIPKDLLKRLSSFVSGKRSSKSSNNS